MIGATQSTVIDVSMISDERGWDQSAQFPLGFDLAFLDRRDGASYERVHGSDDPHLGALDWIVSKSSIAITNVRAYTPEPSRREYLGQLYAYRGWAISQMAEDICPGFPINDVSPDARPIYSTPYTTDSAATYAVRMLDTALAYAHDSTGILHYASVVKGRTLLNLGRYAEAAAAVATVPTSFQYLLAGEAGNMFGQYGPDWTYSGFPLGDREGHNGLPYLSVGDTIRVPRVLRGHRVSDTTALEYDQAKYPDYTIPIVLASGIEARLIEAEVSLHDNGGTDWLDRLNALRTVIGLDTLSDPGTPATRVDLLFQERAFWLWLTGRRLGDMRRLIRNYGRDPETVFPTGQYPLGGQYGNATAIPFVFAVEHEFNPNITTGCTTP